MNDEKQIDTSESAPRKGGRRWLRRVAIGAAVLISILISVFLLIRFVYPVYLQSRLPEDAPRIAFSLDNTLLGRIGITDASYERVIAAAGGRLIKFRPNMAGNPNVDPEIVFFLQKIDDLFSEMMDVDNNLVKSVDS